MSAPTLEQMLSIIKLGALVAEGRFSEAARMTIELGLDLVPVDELREHLTMGAAARAEVEADIAEDTKLPLGG